MCLGLTKVSILYFYLRIFPQPLFQRLTYACMALVVVPSVIFLVLQIIQCRPIRLAWEFWMSPDEPYECFDLSLLAFSSASLSIAQDFVMLLLPLPWLWQLNLKLRRKLGIMLMFSLGIFVLVTSAVRLRYLVKLSSSTNPAWDYTDPILWSGIEVAVSIAVACLPSIRVLLHKVLPQLWSGITSRSNRSRSKSGYIGEGTGQSENTSKVRSAGLFGAARKQGIESESQIELGIQLGDKAKGHVRTEIYGSQLDSREGSDDGIRVDTVTTTQVVDGR